MTSDEEPRVQALWQLHAEDDRISVSLIQSDPPLTVLRRAPARSLHPVWQDILHQPDPEEVVWGELADSLGWTIYICSDDEVLVAGWVGDDEEGHLEWGVSTSYRQLRGAVRGLLRRR